MELVLTQNTGHSPIAIENARVFRSDGFGIVQHMAFDSTGMGVRADTYFPYFGVEPEVADGLRMVGVLRRERVLRHLIEDGPAQIREGDKIVYETEDGTRQTSRKVKEECSPVELLAVLGRVGAFS